MLLGRHICENIVDFLDDFLFFKALSNQIEGAKSENVAFNALFIYMYCIYEQIIADLENTVLQDDYFKNRVKKVEKFLKTDNFMSLKRRGGIDTLKLLHLILRDDIDFKSIRYENREIKSIKYSEHNKIKMENFKFQNMDNLQFLKVSCIHDEIRERRNCLAHHGTQPSKPYLKIRDKVSLTLKNNNLDTICKNILGDGCDVSVTKEYLEFATINTSMHLFMLYDLAFNNHPKLGNQAEELLSSILENFFFVFNEKNKNITSSLQSCISLIAYYDAIHGLETIKNPKLMTNILIFSTKLNFDKEFLKKYNDKIMNLSSELKNSTFGKFSMNALEGNTIRSVDNLKELLDKSDLTKSDIYNMYITRFLFADSYFTDFFFEYYTEEFSMNKLKAIGL